MCSPRVLCGIFGGMDVLVWSFCVVSFGVGLFGVMGVGCMVGLMSGVEESAIGEGDVAIGADDEVVEDGDSDDLAGLLEARCELDVLGGGFGIAAGVVVQQDELDGIFAHGGGEDLLWRQGASVDAALRDLKLFEEAVFLIEHDDPEAFLCVGIDAWSKGLVDLARGDEGGPASERLADEAATQLQRSL